MARFLLTVKDKTVDRLDLADLAIVEFLHTVCAMPAAVTVADFVRLAAEQGWTIDRRKVAGVLRWGAEESGVYSFAPNESKGSNLGAKMIIMYKFPPIGQRLAALGDYLAPRMMAPRRAPATAGEIAAVLGEPADGLESLNAPRAGVLAAASEDREQHQHRAARWRAVWEGNVRHILAGTYQPLHLEPQSLSAPKLRTAIARSLLGEGVEVRQLVTMTGLSKHTALKLAREAGYESVPQTATVSAEQVTDSMRSRGLVIAESGGMATIHTPNVLKRVLTDEEKCVVRHQQAQQRGRARGRLARPTTAQEAEQRRKVAACLKADEQAAWRVVEMIGPPVQAVCKRPDPLDAWCDFQWNIAPPLAPPLIDPDTGEFLTGQTRWRTAFYVVRNNFMSTFALYSLPSEGEDRPVCEPIRSPDDRPEPERPRVTRRRPVEAATPIKPKPDPFWDALDRVIEVMQGEATR